MNRGREPPIEVPPTFGDAGPSALRYLIRQALQNPSSTADKFRRIRATYADWPLYWTTRLLHAPRERIYRTRRGPRLWLRTRTIDFYIADEILRQRVYGFPSRLRQDAVVVDVGAHIGIFSITAAQLVPAGRIVAFEPHPENFAFLKRNIALNACPNIEAFPWAVGGRTGRRTLFLSRFNVGGHSLYVRSPRTVEVQCVGIEDLLARLNVSTVDFLKLDCEGAEHEILESLAPSRLDSIESISAEYHDLSPERNGESLGRLLRQAGFHVRVAPEKRMLHASRKPLPPPG